MEAKLQQIVSLLSGFGSQKMEEIGIPAFLFIMAVSLSCSLLIAFLYVTCYQSRATGSQIHRAFPLLGISITAIFICIQFSLPLSLGLLGALSIIRFRTPIKEPEEVGFIMLIIATSIACATFNLLFLGILLTVAGVALLILTVGPRIFTHRLHDGLLLLTLAESEYHAKSAEILNYLDTHLPKGRLESIHTADGQTSLSYSFRNLGHRTLLQLQTELHPLTGAAPLNIYFNQTGGL
jgi:hypothetical protein